MPDTTRRIARSISWLYSFRWLERLLDFAAIVVLARFLLQEDFGLIAVASSLVLIIDGLSDFNVELALIRIRETSRELFDTAWTLSCIRGLLSAMVMLGVAAALTDPRVVELLQVLAVVPIVKGVANPRFVVFERNLDYSRLALQTLLAKVVSVVVTIAVAAIYQSYWAVIVGMLVNAFVMTGLSYLLMPSLPGFSLMCFKDIFSFTGWMTLSSIVSTLYMHTDKLIVGRFLGMADAGLYFMTQRVGTLPTRELISPLRQVLFPSFSEMAADRRRLRLAVGEAFSVAGSLAMPAAFGFALIANDFVPLVLGDRWVGAVPLLVVLVPLLGMRATFSVVQPCMLALGETRLLFFAGVIYGVVHIAAFTLGTIYFGLPGAVWGIVAAGVVFVFLNYALLQRLLGVELVEILSHTLRPFVSALVMVGAVFLLDAIIALPLFSSAGAWSALWVKTIVGAGVYVITQYGLWRLQGRPPGMEDRLTRLLISGKPSVASEN